MSVLLDQLMDSRNSHGYGCQCDTCWDYIERFGEFVDCELADPDSELQDPESPAYEYLFGEPIYDWKVRMDLKWFGLTLWAEWITTTKQTIDECWVTVDQKMMMLGANDAELFPVTGSHKKYQDYR